MKTDEQYVVEFDALFEKHPMWNDQRVMDMFRAEHGSLQSGDDLALACDWSTNLGKIAPTSREQSAKARAIESLHDRRNGYPLKVAPPELPPAGSPEENVETSREG
jgi:hypothetical protein